VSILREKVVWTESFEHLNLLLDVPVNEPGVAEINEKTRYNPSLLELKPNVELGAAPISHGQHGHSQSHGHHSHSHSQHVQHSYQPLKFRPQAEIKEHKPSYVTHHSQPSNPSTSFTSGSDIIAGTYPGFQPSPQVSKPKTVIKLKKQEVKKLKLITPGLKHYATVPKFVARNDYNNYFRSRSALDEQRYLQGLYRRSPRSYLVPQYAPDAPNYHF
jgi:hypothetical protein